MKAISSPARPTSDGPPTLRANQLIAAAVSGGAMLWLTFWMIGPGAGADTPTYYMVSLPIWVLFAGLLGAAGPKTPVRWSFLFGFGQFAASVLTNGFGATALFQIAFLCALAMPGVAASCLGSWLVRR